MSNPSHESARSDRASAARRRPGAPRVVLVAGTRPEVVKLAPVLHAAREGGRLDVRWVSTAQHGELEAATRADVEVVPDLRLESSGAHGLSESTAGLIQGLATALPSLEPDLVVVQGDTSSAFAAALSAFHARIPVAHVEAGLRSFDPAHPFPEEANRRMIAALAAIHFAHTEGAAENLIAEGMSRDAVLVTGNTGVDAQRRFGGSPARASGATPVSGPGAPSAGTSHASTVRNADASSVSKVRGRRTLVVTIHRRESWEAPLAEMCDAVATLVEGDPSLRVVWPVHVQPRVHEMVEARLSGVPRVELVPPLAYRAFQALLASADLVLTDSGGLQEEVPEFGVPVLILRENTERPEAVAHGFARVVGRSRDAIIEAAREALRAGPATRIGPNPFGDGRAAERIVLALDRHFRGERPLLSKAEQFG